MKDNATQVDTIKKRQRPHARVWQPVFIEMLSQTANVQLSCEAAGITRQGAYKAKKRNNRFALLWEDALDAALDNLEYELHRRAFTGVSKGVWHAGEKVGEEIHYSDTLAMFLMKAHRPEKYRENIKVEGHMTGPPPVINVQFGANDDNDESADANE